MQYNSHADGQDLVSLCNDYANTDNNIYTLASKTRAANKTLKRIWSWIFSVYGGWIFDDDNQSDFPIATTNIIDDQEDYQIPSDALTLRRVEVKDIGGNWAILTPINEEDITQAELEFEKTPGDPRFYRAIGNSIFLYPMPNYNQNASLRVTFDRGVTSFASADTTKTPGFASEFHEAVAIGMAIEWARSKRLNQLLQGLLLDFANYERDIKKFYSERFYAKYPKRITVSDAFVEFS